MCHCTSPKDNKSKKKPAKTYWGHVAHSAVCINLSIFGMTVSNVPVTLVRKQYGLHGKLLGSSAVRAQYSHWQTLSLSHSAVWLLQLEEQWWYRREKVWSTSVGIPWAASGKPKLETELSLQWVRGKRQFPLLAGKARLKGCYGGRGAGEQGLLLVSRFEEVRFQKEIRDLGHEVKYKEKRSYNNISCKSGTLCHMKEHNDTCKKVRTV